MATTHTVDVDGWIVTMTWDNPEAGSGPTQLTIRPSDPENPPAGGLSSTVLRGIDFRSAKAAVQRQGDVSSRRMKAEEKYEADRMNRIRAELAHGVTDEYLALLSSAYVSATKRIDSNPNEYLAEHLGKSVQTIRGHLWKARKQGLLTGSTGRKGGQLTPEAVSILEKIVPTSSKKLGAP